jgi:hypothetical protein
LTKNKGQVAGLGGDNLKKILKEHGITQILAAEGGRTSRGNMGLMMEYVKFLNAWNEEKTIDRMGAYAIFLRWFLSQAPSLALGSFICAVC